jgi:hypothetical protein
MPVLEQTVIVLPEPPKVVGNPTGPQVSHDD